MLMTAASLSKRKMRQTIDACLITEVESVGKRKSHDHKQPMDRLAALLIRKMTRKNSPP